MSKHNKVNKSNYDQAGRLTPDELAREHKKQASVAAHGRGQERVIGKPPASSAGSDDSRPRSESEE